MGLQLVGLLDSPYVRRVAVSLLTLELDFEHRPLSVFRDFDQFSQVNPLVKAPTLLCEDGTVLMESSAILQFAEHLCSGEKSLWPRGSNDLLSALNATGLALSTCEKGVQIVYERELRPKDKMHAPWLDRVTGQLRAGLSALEKVCLEHPPPENPERLSQAVITTTVTWTFLMNMLPDLVKSDDFPNIARHAARAEKLAPFQYAPHGTGPVQR